MMLYMKNRDVTFKNREVRGGINIMGSGTTENDGTVQLCEDKKKY
jgi:hypothetical protein